MKYLKRILGGRNDPLQRLHSSVLAHGFFVATTFHDCGRRGDALREVVGWVFYGAMLVGLSALIVFILFGRVGA